LAGAYGAYGYPTAMATIATLTTTAAATWFGGG
jgi:hypothetical protein